MKGIVNDNTEADAAQYLTGGLWTKDKRAFHGGRIEVRARLHGAKGAWPAIWTLPYETDKYSWPMGGEVDIMERLNHDSYCLPNRTLALYLYTRNRKQPETRKHYSH